MSGEPPGLKTLDAHPDVTANLMSSSVYPVTVQTILIEDPGVLILHRSQKHLSVTVLHIICPLIELRPGCS